MFERVIPVRWRDTGEISNDLHALEKLIGRLRKAHGPEAVIGAC